MFKSHWTHKRCLPFLRLVSKNIQLISSLKIKTTDIEPAKVLDTAITISNNYVLSPYQKFIYALNAPESKRQYPRRFQVFLDYLKINELSIEEKTNSFYKLIEQN